MLTFVPKIHNVMHTDIKAPNTAFPLNLAMERLNVKVAFYADACMNIAYMYVYYAAANPLPWSKILRAVLIGVSWQKYVYYTFIVHVCGMTLRAVRFQGAARF